MVNRELVSVSPNTYSCIYLRFGIKTNSAYFRWNFCLDWSLQNSSQVRSPERRDNASIRKKSGAGFSLLLPCRVLCQMLCVLSL